MRFILVEIRASAEAHGVDWGIPQWRATCAKTEKTIDVFFFATDIEAARATVRRKYPGSTFSDQE